MIATGHNFPLKGSIILKNKLTLGHLGSQAALLVHWRVVILNRGVDDRFFFLKPFPIVDSNVWLLAGRMSFVKILVSNEPFLQLPGILLCFHVH